MLFLSWRLCASLWFSLYCRWLCILGRLAQYFDVPPPVYVHFFIHVFLCVVMVHFTCGSFYINVCMAWPSWWNWWWSACAWLHLWSWMVGWACLCSYLWVMLGMGACNRTINRIILFFSLPFFWSKERLWHCAWCFFVLSLSLVLIKLLLGEVHVFQPRTSFLSFILEHLSFEITRVYIWATIFKPPI